jgi:hypothetical protein
VDASCLPVLHDLHVQGFFRVPFEVLPAFPFLMPCTVFMLLVFKAFAEAGTDLKSLEPEGHEAIKA